MTTSQPALSAGRGLDAVRISLLAADGSRDCSKADGTAYTLCPLSIAVSVDEDAGETQTIRCGNGSVFASYQTDDSVTGITLTLTLVAVDIELIALATGATPLLDSGDIIGFSGGEAVGSIPTEVHAWQQAYSGGSNAAAPYDYWHYAWPSVKWAYRQPNIEEGFGNGTAQLVGTVQGNLNLGNGSFLDIPVEAFESSSQYQARWRASDQPEADTAPYNNNLGGGYIDTPACAS